MSLEKIQDINLVNTEGEPNKSMQEPNKSRRESNISLSALSLPEIKKRPKVGSVCKNTSSDEEKNKEEMASRDIAKIKKDWANKMRRSSMVFDGILDELESKDGKKVKTEYIGKLQEELREWFQILKEAERQNVDEIQIDENILQSDQLNYCQSIIDVTKWLKESADFHKKVALYYQINADFNEKRKLMFERMDSEMIIQPTLDIITSKFHITSL